MRYYETLYLINPNLAEDEYRSVVEKFNGLVEKNKGVPIRTEEWGKKTLAYTIKKFHKGYYVLLRYCGKPGVTDALKRDLGLDERVLKYQTIKLEDHADPEALKGDTEPEEGVEAEGAGGTEETDSEKKVHTEND